MQRAILLSFYTELDSVFYSICSAMENPGGVQTTLTKEKNPFATYCYLVPTLDSSKISELTPPITCHQRETRVVVCCVWRARQKYLAGSGTSRSHSMWFEPFWGFFRPDDSETSVQNQVSLESSCRELSSDVHTKFWGQIIALSSYFEDQLVFLCGTEGVYLFVELCDIHQVLSSVI